MAERYDLLVIGAGPGGYVAAIQAAKLGRRTAVAEAREVGGTCLNRGCIPTKALLHTAGLMDELRQGAPMGVRAEGITLDLDALHAHKREVVDQLRAGVEDLLRANGVDLLRGRGTVQAPGRVTVDGTAYEADRILIATGSQPALPDIPGLTLPGVMTSDDLLADGSGVPNRLCIVGGGVIGVEFATAYRGLGAQVTVVEYQDRLLPMLDREISQSLAMSLKKRGVTVHTAAALEGVEQGDGGLICTVQIKGKPVKIPADGVLVATGRRACTEGLLAPGLDLCLDRGRIPVDEKFATRIPGIYAVGDVIRGSVQLAHAASAQGVNAVSMMFGKAPPHNLEAIPSCVYTQPEIACVGLTADEAKARGIPAKTGKYLMTGNGKTMLVGAGRGFVKLMFHSETDVLLGAQLYCQRATDLVGGLATAMACGLTRQELHKTVFPHPTFSEGIGEAVEEAGDGSIHTMPRRRT